MSENLISVIIPVYNVEKYIDQCLQSVINQTYKNLEIILIDDGSPDNCPEICDKYAQSDSRIRVIHKENGGLASSRNAGLDTCTGDYISFVDSDDWIDCEMYEKMFCVLQENNLDIVCCAGEYFKDDNYFDRCLHYYKEGTVLSGDEITCEILKDNVGSQAVKGLYKSNCWDNVRFPLGRLFEDVPTTYKAFYNARKVGFIEDKFYKYRRNESGISKKTNPIKTYHIYLGFKDHFEFSREHYPEISKECCSKALHYAISTYFHYCSDGKILPDESVNDVVEFLNEHKADVDYSFMPKSRSYALKLYYFSGVLFKALCRVIQITGLQKKLNLELK